MRSDFDEERFEWLEAVLQYTVRFPKQDTEIALAFLEKVYAARVQLGSAIALFLDDSNYLAAITLAGAASRLLHEILRDEYEIDDIGAAAAIVAAMNNRHGTRWQVSRHSIIAAERYPGNWLKHYGRGKNDPVPERLNFDAYESAYTEIDHALTHYAMLARRLMPESQKDRESCFGHHEFLRVIDDWNRPQGIFADE